MTTLNHDQYAEQLKNVNLFLAGKKLEKSNMELYKLLYRKAAVNDNLIISTTINLVASSIGWTAERTLSKLTELKRSNLFHKMELADGRLVIYVKDLVNYARVHH